ncbi:ATP-binding protein, partial [Pseudomonas syringae]
VLMIDEAQHAITTEAGVAALFALKAARDELNSSRHHGLRIVCTGSNRDKLAMLRNSKDQAFFGASMVPFPTLDQNYIDWLCANIDLPS